MPYTPKLPGSLLTAVIYNGDHQGHVTDLAATYNTLNASIIAVNTAIGVSLNGTNANVAQAQADISSLYALTTLATNMSWVKGLRGNTNPGGPTFFEILCDEVMFEPYTPQLTIPFGIGVGQVNLTCNLALAGPIPNGRDQAGAFAPSNFVHLYIIRHTDGSISTLASGGPPQTGPTVMPTGYVHWAYATTVFWNASSQVEACQAIGSDVFYEYNSGGASVHRILSNGTSATFVTLSATSMVPLSVSRLAYCLFDLSVVASSPNNSVVGFRRMTGHADVTGQSVVAATSETTAATARSISIVPCGLNASGQFDYRMTSSTGIASGGLNIEIMGYRVPNGD